MGSGLGALRKGIPMVVVKYVFPPVFQTVANRSPRGSPVVAEDELVEA